MLLNLVRQQYVYIYIYIYKYTLTLIMTHMHTCTHRTSLFLAHVLNSGVICNQRRQTAIPNETYKAIFSDSQAVKKHRMTSSDCMASHGLIRPILLHCGLGLLVAARAQATPVSTAHLSRASHPTVAMCRRELPFLAELTYVYF